MTCNKAVNFAWYLRGGWTPAATIGASTHTFSGFERPVRNAPDDYLKYPPK